MAIFDLPAGARPGRDTPVGQDELGRMVYRTATGQQYTMPEPPRMAPRAAGPTQGPLAYASPQRMAEMSAYASDLRGMQGSYSPQDIAAAGYSPMEVAAFSTAGRPAMPFSQEADRDRQRAPADVLQEPDYTMRQEATYKLQDALMQRLGINAYEAGKYARRVMGDPNAAGILESMGLIDIASMLGGSASLAAKGLGLAGRAVAAAPAALSGLFNVEEGTQTAQRGYQEGSALQTGLGAVQAVAGMAEMFPASKLIAEGIARNVSRMDPNTLFSVFGPPMPPQPVRAPDTGGGGGRPPLTFDEVDRAMQEPQITPITPAMAPQAGLLSSSPAAQGQVTQAPSLGGRVGRISTRFPTAAKTTEDPFTGELVIGLNELKRDPKVYEFNVNIARDYPNMRPQPGATTDETAEQLITHAKDNLLWLHDQVPAATRQRSQLWYDGARNITDRWSQEYGVPDTSIAGALAALSPQKDWYQNVSLAQRVLDVVKPRGNAPVSFTPEMEQTFRSIPSLNKPQYEPLLEAIRGKSYNDITDPNPGVQNTLRAIFVRLNDQTYKSPDYRIVSPEGDFLDIATNQNGSPSKVAWGSLNEIGKAVGAIEAGGDVRVISELMGERHKVRNFYNNIYDPNSPYGDVTIDTHAVAAGLLRPLSGNSLEVDHNFKNMSVAGRGTTKGSAVSGVSGNYGLYAEAYRRAAQERGILPRQMQSITWEAVRGLFPDTFKTERNAKVIDGIWNRYRNGEIEIDEARRMVSEAAGGINPPTWQK